MRPERWKQVRTIVGAALEMDAADRSAFIRDSCGVDRELRDEVSDLLAGEEGAAQIPESFVSGLPMMGGPLPGTMVGAYRLEALIGSGGMGSVYRVSRADDEFEKQAALKLLHPGMVDSRQLRRFRTERQILAGLEHPKIARLLDGGTTADGLPYLVMEYVDGTEIDRFCDDHEFGLRDRIELFLDVCEAVAFAHRNLVVHRDLKPGNILVTEDCIPKLLDFGIAKLLDPGGSPLDGDLTRTGLRPMSPAYASPEQIRGQVLTTGSDVYSLGVVLYRLFTGTLPRDYDSFSPTAMEHELTVEPTAPSEVLRLNGHYPRNFNRRLRGDLDAIVLKALREEPHQRYVSVDEMAADLRRHLDGLPVHARRGTLAYRVGRFVRRHTAAVVVSVLVVVLVLGSVITLLRQNRRISYQRDRAEKMADFSADLFAVDLARWTMDNETPLSSVLWKNLSQIEKRLSADPGLRSDQLTLLARGFFAIGHTSRSGELATEALEMRREVFGSVRPEERPLLNDLAAIFYGVGQFDRSLAVLREVMAVERTGTEADDLEVARSHILLTLVNLGQLEFEEAEAHLERATEITVQAVGEDNIRVAELTTVRAFLEFVQNSDSEEVLSFLTRAVDLYSGNQDISLLEWSALRKLAEIQRLSGDLSQAIDSIMAALEIVKLSQTANFDDLRLSLGSLHFLRGEYDQSAKFLGGYIFASDNLKWQLEMLFASAQLHLAMGELDRASDESKLILPWNQRNLHFSENPKRLQEIRSRQLFAIIALRRGEFDDAREISAQALGIIQSEPDKPNRILDSMAQSAQVLNALGETDQAERVLHEVVELWERQGGRRNPEYVRSLQVLAVISAQSNRTIEACELLEKSRRVVEQQRAIDPSPRINEQLAELHHITGDIHRRSGDLEAAGREWLESLRLLALNPEGSIGADHHLIAGKTLIRLGEIDRARQHARVLYRRGWRWPEWVVGMGK